MYICIHLYTYMYKYMPTTHKKNKLKLLWAETSGAEHKGLATISFDNLFEYC